MQTTRYEIKLPSDITIDHQLSALDHNYAASGNAIGIGYVFEQALNIGTLQSSLAKLILEFPALAGRADFENGRVVKSDGIIALTHVTDFSGCAADYLNRETNIESRLEFVPEPPLKQAMAGDAPLLAVRLTDFAGGGCILGVSLNHGLMDAWGFHLLMRRWSDIMQGNEEPMTMGQDIYRFKTNRGIDKWKSDLEERGMSIPMNYNSWTGRLVQRFLYGMVDKFRARGREMFYLSPGKIQTIKAKTLKESGLDWISTNVALSAHILHSIIPLQSSSKTTSLGVGNVINIRGRVRPENQAAQNAYAGNALYIYIKHKITDRPISELSRGEIAVFLRGAFDDLNKDHLETAMANIVDGLEHGFGYPGLSITKPIMAINNQSKFDVYCVDFGAGRPARVLPQDVGDHIMFFPARDGGCEVYIRDFAGLKRQKKLLEQSWSDRIMLNNY